MLARTMFREAESRLGAVRRFVRPELVLTLAVPALFLHARYRPSFDLELAGTAVTVDIADAAVVALLVTAVATERRPLVHLRTAWQVWVAGALFLLVVAIGTVFPTNGEATAAKAVSAAKFAEFALIAPAVAILLRRRPGLSYLVSGLIGTAVAATSVALLQYFGAVPEFEGKRPWQREPSFVGIHDFAALSGAALATAMAMAIFALERRKPLVITGALAGMVGVILAGSLYAAAGVVAVTLAVLMAGRKTLDPRRTAGLIGVSLIVLAGTVAIRGSAVSDFASFLGLRSKEPTTAVESYAHRTLLAYIGVKIFAAHPAFGVGWQQSSELPSYGPVLGDARQRFPEEPAAAFPSPAHPWGVQNAYIQTGADLGLVGLATLGTLVAAASGIAIRNWRRTRRVAPLMGLLWLIIAGAVWNGLGLFAGLPLEALSALSIGVCATGD